MRAPPSPIRSRHRTLRLAVKPMEGTKQPSGIRHVNTLAVCRPRMHADVVFLDRPEANARTRGLGRELVPVGDEVLQHSLHGCSIILGEHPIHDLDLDSAVGLVVTQSGTRLPR